MEDNTNNNSNILDFWCNERWPNELRTLVSQHLSAKDLLVCRLVYQNWRDCTENEFYCKILKKPYLSDYSFNSNGNYYQLFACGGAQLINTLDQLQDNRADEDLKQMYFLKKRRIDEDLGFYYVEETIQRAFNEEYIKEIKSFLSDAAFRFDCPYLAVPRKWFESDSKFYLVFEDRFEELESYIESIPVEEYNEKLVTKLVTQLIHAMKYLHDRKFCLLTRQGGTSLGIQRTLYGDIHLKLVNYTYHLFSTGSIIPPVHFLSPERVIFGDGPILPTSDLFSLGTFTLYFLTGLPLYDVHPMRTLFKLGKFQSYEIQDPNNELSDLAKDFILRLLKRDPDSRMTLEEALKHPWLTNPQPSCSPLRTAYKNFNSHLSD